MVLLTSNLSNCTRLVRLKRRILSRVVARVIEIFTGLKLEVPRPRIGCALPNQGPRLSLKRRCRSSTSAWKSQSPTRAEGLTYRMFRPPAAMGIRSGLPHRVAATRRGTAAGAGSDIRTHLSERGQQRYR